MDEAQEVKETIRQNLARVQNRIANACQRVGRRPEEVTLVAVSKTMHAQRVTLACEAGVRDLGENRVQEAATKIPLVKADVTWHLIGHLQTNKAKQAVSLFDVIHSVDSVRIAEAIGSYAIALRKEMPILLEVNVSGEATKYGFDPVALPAAVETISQLRSVRLEGLMTVAPMVRNPEEARPFFVRLRELRDELRDRFPGAIGRHLSMGMTDDFEVAIEEGATMVRIGRAIFGERSVHFSPDSATIN